MADYACQNGNNLFIYCPLIFCILPCHTQKYVPLPWSWVKFYDGLIYHKWCHMTPMRDLNRCPRFCLTRSWDTPPWNVAAMLWGSPGDTAESVCRCSSQQPTASINCQPCAGGLFRWPQPPAFKPQQLKPSRTRQWSLKNPSKITDLWVKCMLVLSHWVSKWFATEQ